MDERTHDLEFGRIGPLLMKFALPATVATLINTTYNIVDRIFVARAVGPEGLAATTIAFPIMMIMMAFGMMFAYGSSALISIALGRKCFRRAERILSQAFMLYVFLSVGFTTLGLLFLGPLLRLFGASETILPYAEAYMRVILLGTFFHEVSFGMNNLIRSEGNPRAAMYTMLIGAGLNLLLDPLFLFGFRWGIAGAAWATILAQAVSATWVLWYFTGGPSMLKLRRRWMWPRWRLFVGVVTTGCPPCIMTLINSVIHALMNHRLHAFGGDLAISVMGVIFSIRMVIGMPVMGLSQGAQPIYGYNLGAGQPDRVRRTLRLAMILATAACLACWAIIQLAPEMLFRPFARPGAEALVTLGAHAVRRFMLLLPTVGAIFIAISYFQAVKRPRSSLLLSLTRQVLAFLPALFLLPIWLGQDGIWLAAPVADLAAVLLAAALLARELRALRAEPAPQTLRV